jgi:hypothetical protein
MRTTFVLLSIVVLGGLLSTGCAATRANVDFYTELGQTTGRVVAETLPEALGPVLAEQLAPLGAALTAMAEAQVKEKEESGEPLSPLEIALIILSGGITGMAGYNLQRKARASTIATVLGARTLAPGPSG